MKLELRRIRCALVGSSNCKRLPIRTVAVKNGQEFHKRNAFDIKVSQSFLNFKFHAMIIGTRYLWHISPNTLCDIIIKATIVTIDSEVTDLVMNSQ